MESSGKEISESALMNFLYIFCHRRNVTTRIRTRSKSLSPEQVVRKKKHLFYNLSTLK